MQNVDFISLVLLVICGFFAGSLFQTYRDRRKANKEYGIVLACFLIILLGTVSILYLISKS